MKLLTIEIVVKHSDRFIDVAGRCCRDPIRIGDELALFDDHTARFRVAGIEVYRKSVGSLEHGYVGTLSLETLDHREPLVGGTMIDSPAGDSGERAE